MSFRRDFRLEGTPIRRNSRESGRFEGTFWHPLSKRDGRRLIQGARFLELEGRRPRRAIDPNEIGPQSLEARRASYRRRNGPLGDTGLAVLEAFLWFQNPQTGELDPAIDTICQFVGRSRSTVVRVLKRLRNAGILDWCRRWTTEPDGRRVQDTNAYRLVMPPKVQKLLGLRGVDAPAPDDDAARRQDGEAARDRMTVDHVNTGAGASFDDTPLGRINGALHSLARIRARFQGVTKNQNPESESLTRGIDRSRPLEAADTLSNSKTPR